MNKEDFIVEIIKRYSKNEKGSMELRTAWEEELNRPNANWNSVQYIADSIAGATLMCNNIIIPKGPAELENFVLEFFPDAINEPCNDD